MWTPESEREKWEKNKNGGQNKSKYLYTRSVRLYRVLSAKAGEGLGRKWKRKRREVSLGVPFYLFTGVMGVILDSCSSASCIILGFDSIMFLPFYILYILSYISFFQDLIYGFYPFSLLPIYTHTHSLSLQLQLQGWDAKHRQGPLRVQTRDKCQRLWQQSTLILIPLNRTLGIPTAQTPETWNHVHRKGYLK